MFDYKKLKIRPGRWTKPKFRQRLERVPKIGDKLVEFFDYLRIDVYYGTLSFFSRMRERIKRSLAWAKFAWLNYDFDSAYLFDVMAFKLERILEALKSGYSVQHKDDLDALKEAIKICKRLKEQKYDEKYHSLHDKKWGKSKFKTVPHSRDQNGKALTYRYVSIPRKNVKNKKDANQERKEFKNCWKLAEKDRIADLNRLNEIFKKHERTWWD